jgi:hypothetical protein
MTARLLNVTDEEYHADPCESPALSHSTAHVLLTQSALHAWYNHPRLGGHRRIPTDDMDHGSLIHALVLEEGGRVDVIDAKDWRTNAAKDARDASRKAGRIPVLVHKYDAAKIAADKIRAGLQAQGVHLSGESEVAIEWTEDSASGPVLCRCKIDHLIQADELILDLKTISSADPRNCARHALDYGYCLQRAAYTSAVEALWPDLAGRSRFMFLFAETDPPYATAPAELDGTFRELGERQWRRAVDRWGQCLKTNTWPGYAPNGVATLAAPGWVLSQSEEEP